MHVHTAQTSQFRVTNDRIRVVYCSARNPMFLTSEGGLVSPPPAPIPRATFPFPFFLQTHLFCVLPRHATRYFSHATQFPDASSVKLLLLCPFGGPRH